MRKDNPSEACRLQERVEVIERRVSTLESAVADLRRDTQSGFNVVNGNIETLSQQITNMDRRLIEEKQKWGDTLRGIVKWTVRSILAVVVYAAGVNLTKAILPALFN